LLRDCGSFVAGLPGSTGLDDYIGRFRDRIVAQRLLSVDSTLVSDGHLLVEHPDRARAMADAVATDATMDAE